MQMGAKDNMLYTQDYFFMVPFSKLEDPQCSKIRKKCKKSREITFRFHKINLQTSTILRGNALFSLKAKINVF